MEDEICNFPGIFPPGSDSDEAIKNRWKNRDLSFGVGVSGEISDFGIIERWGEANRAAIHPSHLYIDKVTAHYDFETLALLDFRIRFCRWYLQASGLPYDKEDVIVRFGANDEPPGWIYASEAAAGEDGGTLMNPIELLLMLNFALSGPGYAGKILAHFGRADILLEKSSLTSCEAISLCRELMLIGETWAEAKFFVNHAKAAISGEKVAGGQRNSAHATNIRHVELRERRFARIRELIPTLGAVENAARQCEAEGLGRWDAIVRQWNRHKENPDT